MNIKWQVHFIIFDKVEKMIEKEVEEEKSLCVIFASHNFQCAYSQ